jgi:hypothetical protein
MDDTTNIPNPLKRFLLELGLILFVVIILGLAGFLAFQAVNKEFTLEKLRSSELLDNCKVFYLNQVYDSKSKQIDSTKLSNFYTHNPDCKIYNVTDLDPSFNQPIINL